MGAQTDVRGQMWIARNTSNQQGGGQELTCIGAPPDGLASLMHILTLVAFPPASRTSDEYATTASCASPATHARIRKMIRHNITAQVC